MLFSKKLRKLPNFFCAIWRDLICFRGKDFMLEAIDVLKGVSLSHLIWRITILICPLGTCVRGDTVDQDPITNIWAQEGCKRINRPFSLPLATFNIPPETLRSHFSGSTKARQST